MSRIGKQPIPVPSGTQVKIEDSVFVAEGPKGVVRQRLFDGIPVEVSDGVVRVSRTGDTGELRSKHGLARALLANAVQGVSEGFSKHLEVNGVGYRAELKGSELHMSLGFSHPVLYRIPEGIQVEVEGRTNEFSVRGADRQQVGPVAAEIRSLRKPEPYKGKGIRYSDEIIHRKVGKAGAAK